MHDDDAPLARLRSIRDRAVELRRQFGEIEALFENGIITRTEELDRLRPIMDEVDTLALEIRLRMLAPANVPDLQ